MEFVGGGDNAIALRTDNDTVIKLTVDRDEALLWGMLRNHNIPGMVPSYGAYHLASSETGDTIVYIVHVGYAENELDGRLVSLINAAQAKASTDTKDKVIQYKTKYGKHPNPEWYHKRRTIDFVRAFQQAADRDDRLQNIADALITLSDKFGADIYDLTPPNFRIDASGQAVLIDPSVPDLSGPTVPPNKLLFEQRMAIALHLERLTYGKQSKP